MFSMEEILAKQTNLVPEVSVKKKKKKNIMFYIEHSVLCVLQYE